MRILFKDFAVDSLTRDLSTGKEDRSASAQKIDNSLFVSRHG